MSLVCVTNDHPDLRPCVIPGEHAVHCDRWATRWDRDLEQRVSTDQDCKGCLPAPAEHGVLCWSCWTKTLDALKVALDVITHLRSVDRAAQQDNAGVRSAAGWVLPVPSTWRAADDLIVLLGHPEPGFPSDANVWEVDAIVERYLDRIDPAQWVATFTGAEAAVRFNAAMHSALIQHPMEDYEHRVRNVRCGGCQQRSLLWKPPLLFQGEVRVECTNSKCGVVVDQTGYGRLSEAEQVSVKERLAVERKRISGEKRAAASAARKATVAAAKAAREAGGS